MLSCVSAAVSYDTRQAGCAAVSSRHATGASVRCWEASRVLWWAGQVDLEGDGSREGAAASVLRVPCTGGARAVRARGPDSQTAQFEPGLSPTGGAHLVSLGRGRFEKS